MCAIKPVMLAWRYDMRYIDIHSHLNDVQFDADAGEVIAQIKERDILTITVGTDRVMSEKAIACAERMNNWATIGMHPNDNKTEVWDYTIYRMMADHPNVVGIGECGLDYYRLKEVTDQERARQYALFEAQIRLSAEVDKPLMIHCRSAHDETIALIKKHQTELGDKVRGNIHFFTAGYDIAKQYFALGFTVSFPGVISFSAEYDETVRNSPLDMIMAETDSPYAAPVPHRGKRNSPLYVDEIYRKIAELRGADPEEVRLALNQNALRVFNITP